ncbi:MAG: phosphodiesterase [Chromatiales bacterium]|jgi:Icc protein
MAQTVSPLISERPVRIIQITDLHLCRDPEATLDWGPAGPAVRPQQTLTQVLDEIAYGEPWVDLALATGDLAQEPSPEVYARLGRILADTGYPVHCLAGNHDDAQLLYPALERESGGSRVAVLGDWLVILLDSSRPGTDAGQLCREELNLLEETLLRHPARHVLVALHHNPVPTGSAWLDPIGLLNPEDLFEVLDAHDRVRGVLFGHIHQDFVQRRRDVLLLGSPSTCVQFAPDCEDFQIDERPPAYRWLELYRDGRIQTGVNYTVEEIRRRA